MTESSPPLIAKGFKFSSVAAGIKASGKPDVALILADRMATAAALFTKNLIFAAPIEVGRDSLAKTRGRVRAVVVNSGNANCATGSAGITACKKVCTETAQLLAIRPSEVFPSSTGIIGVPLPLEKVSAQLKPLITNADASLANFRDFANAILTTDTRPKIASFPLQSGRATITGVAKGSGMIHPQLATMLVYILTDVSASAADLRRELRKACTDTFNAISVDGDTSTNDTVLLLASGASGVHLRTMQKEFTQALAAVCRTLAEQVVADGEGVQHVIRLRIEQAKDQAEALLVARTISHSLLVKTAWAGADPNWGRILAAVGRSGIPINPKRVSILIGDQKVCSASAACAFDERAAHQELAKSESSVTVRIGRGRASLNFLTTDLTSDYVRINADYST